MDLILNSPLFAHMFFIFYRATELIRGISESRSGHFDANVDPNLEIIAKIIPFEDDSLKQFIQNRIQDEIYTTFQDEEDSSLPSSTRVWDLYDHRVAEAINLKINSDFQERCNIITDAILARCLIESVAEVHSQFQS